MRCIFSEQDADRAIVADNDELIRRFDQVVAASFDLRLEHVASDFAMVGGLRRATCIPAGLHGYGF